MLEHPHISIGSDIKSAGKWQSAGNQSNFKLLLGPPLLGGQTGSSETTRKTHMLIYYIYICEDIVHPILKEMGKTTKAFTFVLLY
jgi:hypothetical protein